MELPDNAKYLLNQNLTVRRSDGQWDDGWKIKQPVYPAQIGGKTFLMVEKVITKGVPITELLESNRPLSFGKNKSARKGKKSARKGKKSARKGKKSARK